MAGFPPPVLRTDDGKMSARIRSLPGDVEQLLAVGDGLFALAEAEAQGITKSRLCRLVSAGLLVRLARSIYASRAHVEDAEPWPAFALRSRAFTLACGPHAYASGWSAVAIRGLPAISPPPELPQVVVPLGTGHNSNARHGLVRAATLPPEHRTVVKGVQVTSAARTAVDVGRTSPRADALVVADAALAGMATRVQLVAAVEMARGWPGSTGAAWVVEHADPFAESALETLGRLTFIECDLPVPVSNPWLELGPLRYRPDHLLDDRWLIFEGDGGGKYNGRLDAGRVIEKQREREWHLRQAGFEIARYGWRLARHDRRQLGERFCAFIVAHPRRAQPFPWYRETRTYRRAA